jgi:hypothetical protein
MKHWPVEAVENRALCGFPQLPQALLVFIESCITLLDTSPFFSVSKDSLNWLAPCLRCWRRVLSVSEHLFGRAIPNNAACQFPPISNASAP